MYLNCKLPYFDFMWYARNTQNLHIFLKIDNSSAFAAICKMGSTKSVKLDTIVLEIWEWVNFRNNWMAVTHIPDILNVEADVESRAHELKTE